MPPSTGPWRTKTPEEAKAAVMKQYPDYQSVFLLDIMLPGLMQK